MWSNRMWHTAQILGGWMLGYREWKVDICTKIWVAIIRKLVAIIANLWVIAIIGNLVAIIANIWVIAINYWKSSCNYCKSISHCNHWESSSCNSCKYMTYCNYCRLIQLCIAIILLWCQIIQIILLLHVHFGSLSGSNSETNSFLSTSFISLRECSSLTMSFLSTYFKSALSPILEPILLPTNRSILYFFFWLRTLPFLPISSSLLSPLCPVLLYWSILGCFFFCDNILSLLYLTFGD
jgi:hypothetical protein